MLRVSMKRVRLQRLDLHHKLTHHLICENQATTYAVEDLGIKNMVKKGKLWQSPFRMWHGGNFTLSIQS